MAGHSIERRGRRGEGYDLSRGTEGPAETRVDEAREAGESRMSVERRLREAMEDLAERESREARISQRLGEALDDLKKVERRKESTETRLREALESIKDDHPEKKVEAGSGAEVSETARSAPASVDGAEKTRAYVQERLEEEPAREVPIRIHELNDDWVRSVLSEWDYKEWTRETLSEELAKVSESLSESSRVYYTDLRQNLSETQFRSFEEAFRQRSDGREDVDGVRYGLVDERLYAWRPDSNPITLGNMYSDLYYYFRSKAAFDEYIGDVGKALGMEGATQREVLTHVRELAPQMLGETADDSCINSHLQRIRGDHIVLMNDISGKTLPDLSEISRISKSSGKGGIENPRFPHDEELEVAMTRLTAVAITDCHLKANGTLEYYESDLRRISIVQENLHVFGDISLNPKLRKGENLYVSYLPTPLGAILEYLGIPSGDRTVQNPGLFPALREFSPRAKYAFYEDLIPQDGTISGNSIQWTHSNTLDAVNKAEVYGVESKIGKKEVDMIKEYGKKEKNCWVLTYRVLDGLRNSELAEVRYEAQKLWNSVYENPNRLIQDQIEIIRGVGINYRAKPYATRYHQRTGRVSVAWTAEPEGLVESIKLGIAAPPNDIVKREKVKRIMKNHPEYVSKAISQLNDRGIEYNEWWDEP